MPAIRDASHHVLRPALESIVPQFIYGCTATRPSGIGRIPNTVARCCLKATPRQQAVPACGKVRALLRTDLTSKLLYQAFERRIVGCDLVGLFGISKRGGGVTGLAAEADNRHADIAVVRMPRQTILQIRYRLLRTSGRMQGHAVNVGVARVVWIQLGTTA
jgi:hypothetical protein